MKRALLITLLAVGISCLTFIYTFDINHYSEWICTQIEKHTGYQIKLDFIEIEDWRNPQLTISGVEVAYQNKPILTLQNLHISSREFDIWNRHLAIGLAEVQGVNIMLDDLLLESILNPNNDPAKKKKPQSMAALLPWNTLLIDKVTISKVNSNINYQNQRLHLQQVGLDFSDLLIINEQQFVYQWQKGNYRLAIKAGELVLQDNQSINFNDLTLQTDFNILSLQAKLLLAMKNMTINTADYSDLIIDDSVLQLHLEKNKLIVQRLVSNIFSGQVQLQGEVLFTLDALSQPLISVHEVRVRSLLMDNMSIHIPALTTVDGNKDEYEKGMVSNEAAEWPVKTIYIEQANLQNINISSAETAIPLQLKQANIQIQNFQLLDNYQLTDIFIEGKEPHNVSLTFLYFRWQDVIIDEFQGKL